MKSVLVVDDHPVIAVGIELALRNADGFQLTGVVTDPSTCVATIEARRPDALIIDLVFAGVIQLPLISRCRAAAPGMAIVIFSSLPERLFAAKAIEAGADIYVGKSTDLPTLLQRLASVVPVWPAQMPVANALVDDRAARGHDPNIVLFTPREIAIARHLGRGDSIAMIARDIGISSNTVAAHRDNIRKKLACRDTHDLVAKLARMDILGDARL